MKKGSHPKKLDKSGVMSDTHISGKEEEDIVFEDETLDGNIAGKLKKLRDELKVRTAERDEYLTGWQRAKADLINERKNEEEQRKDLQRFGQEGLLLDLIPVLDSFDMASANKEAWEKAPENWRKGVEYIHSQLLGVLKQYGCEPFDPQREAFDPTRHDSIESVPVSEKKQDHTVIEVLQKGYLLNDKVIRPAKVKVGAYSA